MNPGFIEIIDVVAIIVALITGRWLKQADWFNTKFIPIGNMVVIALIKIAGALGLAVSAAHAAPLFGLFAAWSWKLLFVEVARVVFDAFVASGVHTTGKNLLEGAKEGRPLLLPTKRTR